MRAGVARAAREHVSSGPAIGLGLVFGFFVMLVVSTLFGMLGGLFGALLFRKNPTAGRSAADSADVFKRRNRRAVAPKRAQARTACNALHALRSR